MGAGTEGDMTARSTDGFGAIKLVVAETEIPDVPQESLTRKADFLSAAQALRVNGENEVRAEEMLLAIAQLTAEIEETFALPKAAAHAAHRAICAAERKHLSALVDADRILRPKLGAYKMAEKQRLAALQAAAHASAASTEQDAAEAEKRGDVVQAAALRESAPILETEQPAARPVSARTKWSWRVEAEKKIPRKFLTPDTTKINGMVRAQKGETSIPGIAVYPEHSVSVRKPDSRAT